MDREYKKNMRFDPGRHHRKSIRLKGYDYSQSGLYFVTICTQNRNCLFGEVVEDEMILNDAGKMIENVWNELPEHYPHVGLDEIVIMPNHVHGIIVLTDGNVQTMSMLKHDVVGAGLKPAPTRQGLPEIVRAFKTFSAQRINESRNTIGYRVWQRNYHDHIIRNESDLNRIRNYIRRNPEMWHSDHNNPDRP